VLLVVRIRMRKRGKNNEFWMDMGVITARMIMTKRANLGEPKREQECPEQGDHQSPGAYPLFSEDSHVALTLLPSKEFFSLSLRILGGGWMLGQSACGPHTTRRPFSFVTRRKCSLTKFYLSEVEGLTTGFA
jgi:hypothetical protein